MSDLSNLTEEQIMQLPKADLHVHLDGSLRLDTIIDLAKQQKVQIPSETEAGLKELVFKDSYKDLPDYLQGFDVTCSVMQDKEALERVAYEFAWDSYNEGVIYIEPRYSPELLQGESLSIEGVILAIDKGLAKAKAEINSSIEQENKDMAQGKEKEIAAKKFWLKPKFNYSHIVCAMRMWDVNRSLNMMIEAHKIKLKHGIAISALDLAGPEAGFPAVDHKDAYNYAHQNFFYKTVHAGEAFGPSSIFQAISQLNADRIGHGFHLFNYSMINTHKEEKAKKYVDDLVQYIAERRLTLEVCLTSNLQTMPELNGDLSKHTFKKMIDHGLSVAICTDNRLVSNTTVTKELMLAQKTFALTHKQMKKVVMYPIKRAFYPADYLVKKVYIDQCSKYYDQLLQKFQSN